MIDNTTALESLTMFNFDLLLIKLIAWRKAEFFEARQKDTGERYKNSQGNGVNYNRKNTPRRLSTAY